MVVYKGFPQEGNMALLISHLMHNIAIYILVELYSSNLLMS